jgi:S-adenosylmethionine synthetase
MDKERTNMLVKRNGLYTAEAVSIGHPDKLCDLIADRILDEYLKHDRNTRAGIEVAVKDNKVFVFGEVTARENVDIEECVREVYEFVGYDSENLEITTEISEQSLDIAKGVDTGGAGDQGIMFGYACRDTVHKMPLPCVIAREICDELTCARKELYHGLFLPDGKCQVTAEYQDGRVAGIRTIVVSQQHYEDSDEKKNPTVHRYFQNTVKGMVHSVLKRHGIYNLDGIKLLINPAGSFIIGGAYADSGLTGRKIVADAYGSFCEVGGGSFSGKDPTKVDRSGALMARAIAVGILDAFPKVDECKVQLAYAIGKANPVAVSIDTDTDDYSVKERIDSLIEKMLD